jgi:hypothetical protein
MRSLSHRSPLPSKAPLCVSSMVRFCAVDIQERPAQSGRRLGALVLATNQLPTHYEHVLMRAHGLEARRFELSWHTVVLKSACRTNSGQRSSATRSSVAWGRKAQI